MIKNILFDFDGVILDSMKIKGDGFVELFSQYNKLDVKELEKYHYENGGISRFKKIEYFFKNILNRGITEVEVNELADKFGNIISKNLFNDENLILDSVEYIKSNHKKYNLHIVSGAEHHELNMLCKKFELEQFFLSIEGSPTSKPTLVSNILKRYSYKPSETILIGDSINDLKAAEDNNIRFFGYNNENLHMYTNHYIISFKEFKIEE